MHIPQDELQKFQDGTMNTDEMIHFLEHMEQCDFCLDELLQNEVDTTIERADTRTEVLDIITIGGVQYEVYDYLSFETTVGCVYATTTSHLEIKISYPTVNLRGLLVNKEWNCLLYTSPSPRDTR